MKNILAFLLLSRMSCTWTWVVLEWQIIFNVEVNPSEYHKKKKKLVNNPYDVALLPATEVCTACEHSQHYLKTLKSRVRQEKTTKVSTLNSLVWTIFRMTT